VVLAVPEQRAHRLLLPGSQLLPLLREEEQLLWPEKLREELLALVVEWDPYSFTITTEEDGQTTFKDILDGQTVHEQVDENTGMSALVIIESPDEKKQPRIEVRDSKARSRWSRTASPSRPATCCPRFRARPPRPRPSRAACRESSSSSKRGVRRSPPSRGVPRGHRMLELVGERLPRLGVGPRRAWLRRYSSKAVRST
jgi:hypothetical protein